MSILYDNKDLDFLVNINVQESVKSIESKIEKQQYKIETIRKFQI